jgi:cytochrome P450
MIGWAAAAGGLMLAASLPYWLPGRVVALRVWIFERINGEETITIPGSAVGAAALKAVYAHPAANGRSRGAALSDLFWYWLSPGPEVHQEHIEASDHYEDVARTTRRILAVPRQVAEEVTTRHMAAVLEELEQADRGRARGVREVRLRDLMMPAWAGFYHELVFGEPPSAAARALIVGNADDVISALKCCRLRHMATRDRLTRYLLGRVEDGQVPHALPAHLSAREQALYLQGAFFNTAVVQMSEMMTHLLLVLAAHPGVQHRLAADPGNERYADQVINETLRLYPLFGIAHRITTAAIEVDQQTTIPAGSVLCFNYPEYHQTGFAEPGRFDPGRWERLRPREAHHIPFGVTGNRPCPAQGLAPVTIRAAAAELLRRYAVATSVSHTRSIPHRGPCLLVPRAAEPRPLRGRLAWMRLRDRCEDTTRSLTQLVLGTYMVRDARRQRLCSGYFEARDRGTQPAALREESTGPRQKVS